VASTPPVASGERALIALSTQAEVTQIATTLQRLGFTVEFFDGAEERMLALHQGDYELVACARGNGSGERDVYRIVTRLPPDLRRRLFLVVVGEDYKTGEANQAFAAEADLVLSSKDVGACDRLVSLVIHERKRLFQTYLTLEDKKLTGAL
jgi:hypothetical protein